MMEKEKKSQERLEQLNLGQENEASMIPITENHYYLIFLKELLCFSATSIISERFIRKAGALLSLKRT